MKGEKIGNLYSLISNTIVSGVYTPHNIIIKFVWYEVITYGSWIFKWMEYDVFT